MTSVRALATILLALLPGLPGRTAAPAAAWEGAAPGKAQDASPLLLRLRDAGPFALPPDEVLKASAVVPVHEKYGVVELLEEVSHSFDEAWRATTSYRYLYRIDRESALQGWGIVQSSWLPWLEERPLIRGRVITPDGLGHDLDPATIGEARARDDSPEVFEDRKLLRAPLPKVQVGAVVEVEIQVKEHRALSRSGTRRNLPLAWSVPVHCSRLRVELPASAPLSLHLMGLPGDMLKRRREGTRLQLLVEQGLSMPPRPREPLQAWDQEPAPMLTFSTAPSWGVVAEEYRDIVEAQLKGIDLKAWVAAAIGDETNRDRVVARILARLHQQVRYIGLEFGEAAIIPRAPGETLRRGYGDCKDKATLLVALLREAGIEAHVALLRAGEGRDFSPEFAGLAAFNHAIVRVEGPDPFWIDPSVPQAPARSLPLQDRGRLALVVAKGTQEPVLIPDAAPGENLHVEQREVFLAEDGPGRIVEVSEAFGAAAISLRANFTGADPTRLKESLQKYVKDAYQAEELGTFEATPPPDLRQPFRLRIEARKAGIARTSSTDARVSLNPWPLVTALKQNLQPGEQAGEEGAASSKEKGAPPARRTDLLLPHPWVIEHRWTLHLPKGYGFEELPASRSLSFGPATLSMVWQPAGVGVVMATYTFNCSALRWSPKEVESARAAIKAFGAESIPTLVFQQLGEAHLAAGRLKEALAEFRALAEAQPAAAAPLVRLAKAQLQAGLGESARDSLRRAISLDPVSEEAHRELGWTLEHDLVGRRFAPGWDRTGAVAELRKSMELAPEGRAGRIDLAILLGHDGHGEWHASKDMEEVVRLYRDQLSRGKDEKAQGNLTVSLARMGRFREALESARAMDASEESRGWVIALSACLGGSEAAIQDARRDHQDPETRRQAFHRASNLLMDLRRYPEAGALAKEGVGSGGEAAKLQSRALLCARLKRYETVPIDRKTPAGAVLALAKEVMSKDRSPERLFELLSPAQRPARVDAEAARQAIKGFLYLSHRNGETRDLKLDEAFSVEVLGQEGSDQTGYRLRSTQASPFPTTMFVTCQKGTCYVVGWNNQAPRLGREALWDLNRGHVEGARAWLDRAFELVMKPSPEDPLLGHPAAFLWKRGSRGGEEEVRLAAASLIFYEEEHEPSRKILEASLPILQDVVRRSAVLRCLLSRRPSPDQLQRHLQYSADLQSLYPDEPRAAIYRSSVLGDADRLPEALTLLDATRVAHPQVDDLLNMKASLLRRTGQFEAAKSALLELVRLGRSQAVVLNNLAWIQLCSGDVTEQTAEWGEQALQLQRVPNYLHTQACVLALLGRAAAARDILLEGVPRDEVPRQVDWFAFGAIAEALGDLEAASRWYGKLDGPGDSNEDPRMPNSCAFQARQRLARLVAKPVSTPSGTK